MTIRRPRRRPNFLCSIQIDMKHKSFFFFRFQRPEPPRVWQGVREVGGSSDICPQYLENPKEKVCKSFSFRQLTPVSLGKLVGSEDCLYLNIITPDNISREKRPVMIWIHGGGFTQVKLGRGFCP